ATNLPDYYADLARHYVRSNNVPKAVSYLHLAALQALSQSAYQDASSQLTAALELVRTQVDSPERDRVEIALVLDLTMCLGVGAIRKGWEISLSMLERVLEISYKIGDKFNQSKILEFLTSLYGL